MAQTNAIHTHSRIEDIILHSSTKCSSERQVSYTHTCVKNITHSFVLVTDGTGTLTTDDAIIPIAKNSFFLIHAESNVSFASTPNEDFSYLILTFECPHVDTLISLTKEHPHLSLRDGKMERRMRAIHTCLEDQTNRTLCRALSYFYAILAALSDSKPIAEQTKSKNAVKTAIDYINSNYMNDKLTITSLAEMLFLNRSYFSELFKKETGMTAVNYINEVKLKKGMELLAKTDLTISQISDEIGMNYVWFSKLFKSRFGISPAMYRQDLKDGKNQQ